MADSSAATKLSPNNANAYLRKGCAMRRVCVARSWGVRSMALFSMDEFATAKAALEKGASLDPSNSQFKLWLRKCEAELSSAWVPRC